MRVEEDKRARAAWGKSGIHLDGSLGSSCKIKTSASASASSVIGLALDARDSELLFALAHPHWQGEAVDKPRQSEDRSSIRS